MFISNFLDGTGWSEAGRNWCLSLDASGVDVAAAAIKLNSYYEKPTGRLEELLKKNIKKPDVVIQHCLPSMMDYCGKIPINVGFFVTETSNFKMSGWAPRINLMDSAWVANKQSKQASMISGVEIPIKIIPHALDINKFQRNYKPIPEIEEMRQQGDFIFYFVGEFTKRKNLAGVLRAFHTEFSPNENVQLIIKTSSPGIKQEKLYESVNKYCEDIKNAMKLYHNVKFYKKEVLLLDRLTEEDLMRLHSSCDCFVTASYGEAACQPAMDALGFGKTPITPDSTGFPVYNDNSSGWMIPCNLVPAFASLDSLPNIYTSNESWSDPSITYLREAMREAFSNDELRKSKAENSIRKSYEFTYSKIGKIMSEALYESPEQKADTRDRMEATSRGVCK